VARLLTARACAGWLAALFLALLLHALALALLGYALQSPSLLRPMAAPPLYTRTLVPQAAAPVPAPELAAAAVTGPNRPSALIRPARPAVKKRAKPASAPAAAASAAARQAATQQAAAPEPPASLALAEPPAPPLPPASESASAPLPALAPASEPAPALASASASVPALASASSPAAAAPAQAAASAPDPEFLAGWPRDTRLTYTLGGNYRGELHGSAHVLWQREGTRYQAVVEMNAGLLASLSLSSQGQITAAGLRPRVYEEATRSRRRGVRLDDEDVRLQNGERLPRPEAVQDTASQFVELAHRFATGQTPLAAGGQIRIALARPGGIDDWIYDVQGQETLSLPRLGPVAAWHLKPRRSDGPRGPLSAELWFAPSLQYLPVRIRITQDADTYMDLLAQTIEQQ